MRKIVSLAVFLLSALFAVAQTHGVNGKVTDQNGEPVPFATISVKGTRVAVAATADGSFRLNASNSDVLIVSAVNFQTKEVTVGAENNITIALVRTSQNLTEVVVTTAFNVKKDVRTTPYSAQVIKADALNIIPQTNLNDALAGKVAGVQFRSQSGTKLNSQAFARIRGGLLLSGDAGPLYVVDGTIVGDAYDIDPNNVESVNILKGANATALFGSRATNGAIIITTLKAAQGRTSFDISQGMTFDRVYRLPHLQNSYAGGSSSSLIPFTWTDGMPEEWKSLDGKAYPDYTDDASWGPKMEGQEYIPWYAWIPGTKYTGKTAKLVAQPNNIKDFWDDGLNSNTNFNFYSAGKGYNTRLSFSKEYIKGLIPDSKSDRNVISTNTTFDLNSHISAGIDITYNTQKIFGEYNDGYANQSSGNFGQWNHRDIDMNIMRELQNTMTPIGTLATWNYRSNPSAYDPAHPDQFWKANYWYNFYAYQNNLDYQQRRDRVYGNVYLQYKFDNHLSIRGTVRKDILTYYYENKAKSILEASALQTGFIASYNTGQHNQNETNYELIAQYNNTFFRDLGVNVLAGGNILDYLSKDLTAGTVNGLIIYDLYSLSNSKANPSLSNSRQEFKTNSIFASGDFEYKKFISATWAVRQDWSSTLPAKDNGLFYPSAGFAFIPTEFTKQSLPWLSFAKLYGSWGKKPLSLGVYALNFSYPINQNKWNGAVLQSASNSIPANDLTGALITSYEAGLELHFLKNRLSINANYYYEKADNQPIAIQLPGQSGYTSETINAASVRRSGIEITIDGQIVKTRDFSWTVTKTFGYLMDNKVTKMIEGTTRIQPSGWIGAQFSGNSMASAYQVLGQDWGQLIGGGYATNSSGQRLVDPNTGLFAQGNPDYNWGGIVPKVTGGLQSLFTYKNFVLNTSFDYQVGGRFFSLTESWGTYSGLLDYTAANNDRGHNVRDALANGGGVRVVGVSSADGKTPVDMYVDANTYFHQFFNSSIAAPFVHKLSYVKLREISLGYSIPAQKIGFLKPIFKGITVSAVARNVWLIYSETKNFDPSEISGTYGEDGQLPSVRSLGFNVKFNF